MSVDTRTPRTPTGDRSSGFDDAPALSMVKVPSDPAQVIVNHASFRVQLGATAKRTQSPRIARHLSATQDTARMPVVGAAGRAGAAGRRRPVVWSGKSAPDDTGAHRLLQAVRGSSVRHADESEAGATQVIPRVQTGYADTYDALDQTVETPVVGHQRTAPDADGTRLLPHMRTVTGAYDDPAHPDADQEPYGPYDSYDTYDDPVGSDADGARPARRQGDDPARHAYYPGRRLNLGVVLLPLRIFLGFISIYAGMGKLCDPVYFDGGERGSMVKWLNTLHPWDVAEPLRQFALQHPVGSGLVIAFLQVVVGVLTVLGCWQRVTAVVGALLSAALIVTVSWKTVPVYDAPDIIYLAAWSPLIIAGAPVYSVDGRLAGSAWRRLGPRSDIWELRRYVLRRGALITAVTVGLTLLIGSLLGGAVRDSSRVVVPGPGEAPRNHLPGSPLPQEPGERRPTTPSASSSPTGGATAGATPSGAATTPGTSRATSGATTAAPTQTQGTTGQVPPRQTAPTGGAPSTTAGPTSTGGGGTSTSGATTGGSTSTGGGSTSTGQPGLVGGLLG
ncbi:MULTISPECIES: DoxX family membrane protein [Streptomyces]|uniref:DoxX family membrane protein n=3 Tax=Streptomyces TaxID=1883 RepID=A0ABS9JGK2_9ACTN|nr:MULTISPECIES: DoxX family membrane protein [Streptomyces]MCG0064682.1 DoxX family membrane protein [Streptomyces tricolor]CUW29436.1 DoxX [Streptomyces reticuli]